MTLMFHLELKYAPGVFFTLAPFGWKMRLCLLDHALPYPYFCKDMNGVNPFICCYNIKSVVLPKCLALMSNLSSFGNL